MSLSKSKIIVIITALLVTIFIYQQIDFLGLEEALLYENPQDKFPWMKLYCTKSLVFIIILSIIFLLLRLLTLACRRFF